MGAVSNAADPTLAKLLATPRPLDASPATAIHMDLFIDSASSRTLLSARSSQNASFSSQKLSTNIARVGKEVELILRGRARLQIHAGGNPYQWCGFHQGLESQRPYETAPGVLECTVNVRAWLVFSANSRAGGAAFACGDRTGPPNFRLSLRLCQRTVSILM